MKPIETADTLPGGKILLTERTRQDLTSHQMEVLAVGPWSVCDDLDCERHHVLNAPEPPCGDLIPGRYHPLSWDDAKGYHIWICAGDWVLIAHRSLSETDIDNLFICSQDDVLAVIQL